VLQAVSAFRLAAAIPVILCMGTAAAADTMQPVPATTVAAASDRGPQHVGAKVCAECHRKEYEAWGGSHHALAMQDA
jgi:opacity protein-like surface antigen